MSKDNQKLIPNSTQIPNLILDFLRPQLSEAERECILYICRRTYGFHKDEDQISFSQFVNGIRSREGKVLDLGTGLSRRSVAEALKNLYKAGAINTVTDNRGNYYRINLSMDVDKVVQKLHQCRICTRSSAKNAPKQGQLLHPQKKEKQRETKNSVFHKKNAIEILSDYYLEKKNNQSTSPYNRLCKISKQVLGLCNDNLEEAKKHVDKIHSWASKNKLDWSLETIIKRFYF